MHPINKNIEICNKNLYQGTAVKGVLFDMDGVILDTEKLYVHFWQEAAKALGYPMTYEQALGMRSLSKEAGTKQLKTYFGDEVVYEEVRDKRIELMNRFIEVHGVEAKAGIFELVEFLKEKDIKIAIATSSPLERARKYLKEIGIVEAFDAIISGHMDMVKRGKPEPDIYVYAAEKLGLKPQECLVLEDSPNGIQAAFLAGCIPIMIPDLDLPNAKTKQMLYATAENLVAVKCFFAQ